jgi:AraC-like DNA-binding protein
MDRIISVPPAGVGEPWGPHEKPVRENVAQYLKFDAHALGIFKLPRPQADELLIVDGLAGAEIGELLGAGFEKPALIKNAMRQGVAIGGGPEGVTSDVSLKGRHLMAVMAPDSMSPKHWWWWLVARKSEAFSETEQEIAKLMLSRWQVGFSRFAEPGMGRVLLGSDDRIILVDLDTRIAALKQPTLLDELVSQFRPIVNQRYPDLPTGETHDLALRLTGQDIWIRFLRRAAIKVKGAEHWYLELRPLETDELPIVGEMPDPRLAQAMAYLHDNYPDSPSLTNVARQVHMSPFHFHRLFSKQAGISPKHYLQKKQLQTAKWLLRSTKEPIGSIAAHTGFASHGHFTSTFHRLIGVSPSQYRQADLPD